MLRKHLIPLTLGLFAFSAGSPLFSEDIKLGAQIGAGFPTGTLHTLVDGKAGFTAGAFALVDLREGRAIRPRLDYFHWRGTQPVLVPVNFFPGAPSPATAAQTTRVTCWSLGADYLRFLEGHTNEGVYLLAGLGISSNQREADVTLNSATLSGSGSRSQRSTRLALNVGAGYQFNPTFGAEAGYRLTSLGSPDVAVPVTNTVGGVGTTYNATALQSGKDIGFWSLGVTVRF